MPICGWAGEYDKNLKLTSMDLQVLADEVSERLGFPVTAADVRRVCAALAADAHFWSFAPRARVPLRAVGAVVASLEAAGLVNLEGEAAHLTPAGRTALAEAGISPLPAPECSACRGTGVAGEGFLPDRAARFYRIAAARPAPVAEYDQIQLLPEDVWRRVAFMAGRGDLAGLDLLVLGDDDLLSVAAALTGLPRRVVVLEVDQRLVDFINIAAQEEGLSLSARVADLREPLDPELVGAFDTFHTDPPEALAGLLLFIGRGIVSLRGPGAAGYFGLTRLEGSAAKWYRLERALLMDHRVVITDLLPEFSRYQTWDYLLADMRRPPFDRLANPSGTWYNSSFVRIEKISDLVDWGVDGSDIYFDTEGLVDI